MKTKAAILVEQRQPLVIDEVEIPALQYGQVLVDIKKSRICGSQLGEIDGVKGPDRWLPHLLGHEAGGVVMEIGPGVRHIHPNDHVVLHWRPGDGIEAQAPLYRWGNRIAHAGPITTFNQYAIVSENRLTAIPKDISFDVACLMADTLTTGFGIINNDAKVKIGESLVLFGAGGIGSGVVLGAQLAGAHPVVVIDLYPSKLDFAKSKGATHIFLGNDPDLKDKVLDVVGPQGADIVIDGTGNPRIIEQCYQLTQPKGRCILYGVMSHDARVSVHTLPLHFGKILTGSEGGSSQPHKEIPRYLNMIKSKRFNVNDFITHHCSLEHINETIQEMRNGKVLHALIDFEQ